MRFEQMYRDRIMHPPLHCRRVKLLLQARSELDATKRKEIERQACAYIADQCWHLAVFRDVSYTVSHPNVKGLQIIWSAASSDWAKNTWVER